jgi:hypothetical protein
MNKLDRLKIASRLLFEGADSVVWYANNDCEVCLELVFIVDKLHCGRIRLAHNRFEMHCLSGAFNPDTNFTSLEVALTVATVESGEQYVDRLLDDPVVTKWLGDEYE